MGLILFGGLAGDPWLYSGVTTEVELLDLSAKTFVKSNVFADDIRGVAINADLQQIGMSTEQETHKLVVIKSHHNYSEVVYGDLVPDWDVNLNFTPFVQPGRLDNSQAADQVQHMHDALVAQTPSGKVVMLSRDDNVVKVMSNKNEVLYHHRLGHPAHATMVMAMAANDDFIYLLKWKSFNRGAVLPDYLYDDEEWPGSVIALDPTAYDTGHYPENTLRKWNVTCKKNWTDDRYYFEKYDLITGDQVFYEVLEGVNTDVRFTQDTFYTSLSAVILDNDFILLAAVLDSLNSVSTAPVIEHAGNIVNSDTVLEPINNIVNLYTELAAIDSIAVLSGIDLQNINNVINLDVVFDAANLIPVGVLFTTNIAVLTTVVCPGTKVQYGVNSAITLKGLPSTASVSTQVDWYIPDYTLGDTRSEAMMLDTSLRSYELSGILQDVLRCRPSVTPTTDYTRSHVDMFFNSVIWSPLGSRDKIGRNNYLNNFNRRGDFSDVHTDGVFPGTTWNDAPCGQVDIRDKAEIYTRDSMCGDITSVRMVATDKSLIISSTVPNGSHALEGSVHTSLHLAPDHLFPWHYKSISQSPDHQLYTETFTHIRKYDLETIAPKKDNITVRCGGNAGFDATEDKIVLSSVYGRNISDYSVALSSRQLYTTYDVACYNFDGGLIFDRQDLGYNGIEDLLSPGGYRVGNFGKVRLTDIGILAYNSWDASIFLSFESDRNDVIVDFKDNIQSAYVGVFPNFCKIDTELRISGVSACNASVVLFGSGAFVLNTDVLFGSDDTINTDCFFDDSHGGYSTNCILADIGYYERTVIVSQSQLVTHKYPNIQQIHRNLWESQCDGVDFNFKHIGNPNQYQTYRGTYPYGVCFWALGTRSSEGGIDAGTPSWVIEDDVVGWLGQREQSHTHELSETPEVPGAYTLYSPSPMPYQYEVDQDESFMFAISGHHDDDTMSFSDADDDQWLLIVKYLGETGPLLVSTLRVDYMPSGVLYRITDPNRGFDAELKLPGKLLSTQGTTWFTYRKISVDKTNKRIFVIRAHGGASARGYRHHWPPMTDKCLSRDTEYRCIYGSWPFDENCLEADTCWDLSTPWYSNSNDYTNRDVLIFDYDLQLQGTFASIKGIGTDEVFVHFYEKDGIYYILTQVKSPHGFDVQQLIDRMFNNSAGSTGQGIHKYKFTQYTYSKTRLYTVNGSLLINEAELLYEFDRAGSSLDSLVIQEVTDTHLWLNWDGVNVADAVYLNGVAIRLDGTSHKSINYLQAITYNETSKEWELMLRRQADDQTESYHKNLPFNFYLDSQLNRRRLPTCGVNSRYNVKYESALIRNSSDEWIYTPYYYIYVSFADEIIICKESDFSEIRREMISQEIINPIINDINSPYPAVSRVFRQRLYYWVSLDCTLKAIGAIAQPPSTWIKAVENSPGIIDL